jgi:hypothetical protein
VHHQLACLNDALSLYFLKSRTIGQKVEIDDALELMKSRLEFYAVLKEKGIHLVSRADAPWLSAICNLGRT